MTKDKYMFELIERCMHISCLDNILVENFELKDDSRFYEEINKQFLNCMRFYQEMLDLFMQGRLSEEQMDEELLTVLEIIRQKEIRIVFNDLVIYLNRTGIPEEKKIQAIEELKTQLQEEKVDSDYFLRKIREFRLMEQC